MTKSKYPKAGKSTRSNKKTGRAPLRPRAGAAKVSNMAIMLDIRARQYLTLLKNPCSGPLVGSVSPLNGSIVSRYAIENSFVAGVASDFAIFLSPGDLNNNAGQGGLYIGSGATGVAMTVGAKVLPGTIALAGYAGTVKPIAACIDIRWGGTENNRAGLVGKFASTGKLVEFTDGPTATNLLSSCFEVAHMPADSTVIKWRPNAYGDQTALDPNNGLATSPTVSGQKSQVGVVIPAIAVGGTIFYRVTVVYEWTPIQTGGQVTSPYTPASSTHIGAILAEADRDLGWLTRLEQSATRAYQTIDGAIKTGSRLYRMAEGAAEMIMPFL